MVLYSMMNTDLYIKTPLIESLPLSKIFGGRVFLKLENTQPAGSFKIRGIGKLCTEAVKKGINRFISSSGGNAGFASAFAGYYLGIKTTVFVPETTGTDVIKKIEDLNAEVIVSGKVWDETHPEALAFAEKTGGLYISPFDHPLIWEGHASMIDEMAGEMEKPDAVVLSVGGGGLLCGVLQGMHNNGWEDVPVYAVETEGTASFAASQKAGRLITLEKIEGIATSLGAKTVAEKTLEWDKIHTVKSLIVSDIQALSACRRFADDHRYLVEPACGASLSAVYENLISSGNVRSVVVVVCGGVGISLGKFNK